MASFARDPERLLAAKDIVHQDREALAGEDAREPAGRSGYSAKEIIGGFRRKRSTGAASC
ncbi:MAG: hypothetical protein IKX40_11245 [Thermoguttaceae bacterium]|nr:hypothetical protein [Thermoguttaceae bacterium]